MTHFRAPGTASITRPLSFLLALALASQAAAQSQPDRAEKSEKPKPAAKDNGPKVVSKAKDDETRGKSTFLRPPGAGRYDPESIDWRDVPPWRQASFFGIRARGQFFVYVIDCSGSMFDEE